MTSLQIGFLGIAAVLVLLALRVPIGVALGGVALVGLWWLRGLDVALGFVKSTPFDFAAHWELSAIPMFLLMGSLAHHTGISTALFRAARLWLGGLPGGLAIAANFACAGFAAASGSSVATAAAMGRIALPEMLRAGYDKALATGVVASSGTLGSLIPPSILFVLFGVLAEVSISKLLIAGIFPGLLTAAVYAIMIFGRCVANPAIAPRVSVEEARAERWAALGDVWPLLCLILGIIGGIYAGFVTATEAGAFGAFLTILIATIQRHLDWKGVRESIVESIISTSAILFVAVGAVMLTKFLALTGVPAYMGKLVASYAVDPLMLVIAASVVYLILGCFLDPLGIMLITIPVFLPMFEAAKLDLIWFGVIVVKYLEIGLLTPPIGFNVYVIKTVVGDQVPLETIFRGVMWFLACEVVVMALLIAFPQISLYLPNQMD